MHSKNNKQTIDYVDFSNIRTVRTMQYIKCRLSLSQLPVISLVGTSTDVSRYAGSYEHVMESYTAGITVQAPQVVVYETILYYSSNSLISTKELSTIQEWKLGNCFLVC